LLHYIRRFGDPDRQIDAWGYEPQMLAAAMRVFEFLYNRYWRVSVSGIEQVPSSGRALLVCNHSGQLPWDATMIATTLLNHHPAHRLVRTMTGTWFTSLPFLSTVLTRLGQAPANEDNAVRLLAQEQLLLIFPEGVKGLSKLYEQRYQLARFGRGGFARMALLTGTPLIPVAVVGAEETFISIAKLPWIDELFGYPFLPVTLTWPWLGLLGLVPLPTKWTIDFGDPIPTAGYGPGAAGNLLLVSMLSNQVRNAIQGMLLTRLQQRRSVWWG
jgi:1-acyl-sn-glycerol-3-phosphate acyltransferase